MTSGKPRFTVVTPVRNGERYLDETIRSIRAQTWISWEYFIMDAKSTDGTLEIARRHAREDPRIQVVSERDGGMYDGVLRGLARGSGTICCWLNADDKMLPWAMELVAEHMQRSGARWVTGSHGAWDARGRLWMVHVVHPYPRDLLRRGMFHGRALGIFVQQESTFFARSLLDEIGPEGRERVRKQKLAGDFILWTEFAKLADLEVIPTVLAGFRFHASNASQNMDLYYREIEEAGFRIPGRIRGFLMRRMYFTWAGHWAHLRYYEWHRAMNRP